MLDIILESVRLLLLVIIIRELHLQSKERAAINRAGWQYIKCGFWLILFGSAMDVTDNFESLNVYIIIGDTPFQAFLEKVVGYLGGFCLLAIGLQKWLPSVSTMADEIRARKKSEKETAELNNKYQFHMSQTPVAFIEWNTENKITAWNKAAETIFGYPAQEMLGNDLKLIFPAGALLDHFGENQRGNSVQFNGQNLTKGGNVLICRWACTVLFDESGLPAGQIALVQDITQAQQDKERLELVIQSNDIGLWEWECLNDSIYRADRYYTLLGYNPGETSIDAGSWLTLLHPDELQRAELLYEESLETDWPAYHAEHQLLTKSGEYRWFEISSQAVWDSNGHLVRVAGSIKDIDQQKQAEQALVQAKNTAVHANQAKSTFLATMSHEIRTPINGVVGMVELLQQSKLTTDQHHMVNTIRQSSNELLSIINDILDLSKIEANRLELEQAPFSVTELLENTAALMRNAANKKGIKFWLELPTNVPDSVIGDKTRIRQILLNLLSNAIKFTDNRSDVPGEIVLKCESQLIPDTNQIGLTFSIQDNGIGISSDAQKSLFNPFTQAEQSTTRRFGGTGLGLTICKELSALMGGGIDLGSRLGEGSIFKFTVELPLTVDGSCSDDNKDLSGKNVLVLYQEQKWRNVLENMLLNRGANTEFNNLFDPETALTTIPMLNKHDRLIVLFTPEWSSLTIGAFQQELIKAELHEEILLVQLVNGSYPVQALNAVSPFMVDANPVLPSELVNSILQALESKPLPYHNAPPLAKENTSGYIALLGGQFNQSLCLVVEDNPVNQEVLLRQLNLLGYKAMVASNGCEAFSMWQDETFDLILTDYHMPEMDGVALTRKIRKAEINLGTRIPIIGITADALLGVKERCINAGMDDCLNKPTALSELNKALNTWTTTHDQPFLDPSCLIQLVGDDPELHAQFLEKFRSQAVITLSEIKDAEQRGEGEVIRAASHKLKSSARAVGALQLAELLQYLESIAKNSDWAAINSCVDDIDKQLFKINKYCDTDLAIDYSI